MPLCSGTQSSPGITGDTPCPVLQPLREGMGMPGRILALGQAPRGEGLTCTTLPHSWRPAVKVTVLWAGFSEECLHAAGPSVRSATLTKRPVPKRSLCTVTTS